MYSTVETSLNQCYIKIINVKNVKMIMAIQNFENKRT